MPVVEEMRSLSKILKSSSVNLKSPVVVAHQKGDEILSRTGDSILGADGAVNIGAHREEELAAVREQTNEILRETEQMVKDLIETARIEAEKIVWEARKEADEILTEGKENLKQIQEEGFNNGFSSGYEEGIKKAEEDCQGKLEEARNIVDLAHEERNLIITNSERDIIELAMAVCRKIIGQEIHTNSDFIVEIAKRAILKATDRDDLTLRLNPGDLDTALNARDELTQSAKGIKQLKIVSDPAIEPGGCVVDTPNGTVDARLERQLNEMEQSLMEVSPDA